MESRGVRIPPLGHARRSLIGKALNNRVRLFPGINKFMSKIEYFEIKIHPDGWTREARQMTVRVRADGKEFAVRELCQLGDLDSYFDYMFERAKQAIKEEMLQMQVKG